MLHYRMAGASAAWLIFAVTTPANAGGLDRTDQSLGILFEPGTTMEVGLTGSFPDVKGTVAGTSTGGSMLADDFSYRFGIKTDVTDRLSAAIIVDEPFAATLKYPVDGVSIVGGSRGKIETSNSLTFAARYNFESNISVIGAVRAVNLSAELFQYVGGTQIYGLEGDGSYKLGFSVGIAYEIPQIAMRVALTYNSEIDSEIDFHQSINGGYTFEKHKVTLPDSLNLEFQTGIAPDTLIFGSVRYVDWPDFVVETDAYSNAFRSKITQFEDPTVTSTLGVARVLNKQWTIFAAFTYEAGHNPTLDLLGPVDGFKALTMGATVTIDKMRLTGSVSHAWLGDIEGETANGLYGSFRNNEAWMFRTKLAYTF